MRGNDEKVVEIEIERLHDFKNHPFKVQADSQMKELQDSISKYGILNPLIVRPRPEGFYEVISGHRRKYAAMELKYTKVPVIIRYMLDEEGMEKTQKEVADLLGISQSYISRLEKRIMKRLRKEIVKYE